MLKPAAGDVSRVPCHPATCQRRGRAGLRSESHKGLAAKLDCRFWTYIIQIVLWSCQAGGSEAQRPTADKPQALQQPSEISVQQPGPRAFSCSSARMCLVLTGLVPRVPPMNCLIHCPQLLVAILYPTRTQDNLGMFR